MSNPTNLENTMEAQMRQNDTPSSDANIDTFETLSRTGNESCCSTSSSIKRMEAQARAAEERAKFLYEEKIEEMELSMKLREAELERDRIFEASKLAKLKREQRLAMAEAAAQAYNVDNNFGQSKSSPCLPMRDRGKSTEVWVEKEALPFSKSSSVNDKECVSIPPPCSPAPATFPETLTENSPLFLPPSAVMSNTDHSNDSILRHMTMQQDANREIIASLSKQSMPKCTPDIFYGDAALFLPWKNDFKHMVSSNQVEPDQEITFLLNYTAGKPKEIVNAFRRRIHPNSQTKLRLLWKTLEERFGHSSEVTNALLEKLIKAAEFNPEDRRGYQDFYDKCEDVCSQIPYLQGLAILNSPYYMKFLLTKVPKVVKDKWESKVSKCMMESDTYPQFQIFVEMLHQLSLRQNHPAIAKVDGVDLDLPSKLPAKPSRFSHRHTRTLKTDVKPATSKKEDQLCPIHPNAPHSLLDCRVFAEKSVEEREQIIREARLCFRCLKKKHFSSRCTVDVKCSICGCGHQDLLHRDKPSTAPKANGSTSSHSGEEVNSACMSICGNSVTGKSCGKITLVDVFNENNPNLVFRTYATMDDQSSHTLGTSKLFDFLGITEDKLSYTLETCHGKETCYGRRGSNLLVRSITGNSFKLPTVIETNNIPENKDEIPTPESVAAIPHLAHLAKYLPPLENSVGIDILIGRDAPELLKVRQSINGPPGAPWAQLLDLGWTVSGEMCLDRAGGNLHIAVSSRRTEVTEKTLEWKPCDNQIRCKEEISPNTTSTSRFNPILTDSSSLQLSNDVFYTSDSDTSMGLSFEDRSFLKTMETGFHKNNLGNWEAPLPFRNPDVHFPNNYVQVEKRFFNLVRNFKKNEQLKRDYFEFMGRILEKGHASTIPSYQLTVNEGMKWYIPHFGVYHPRKPTKLRVVFDASAEYGGTSLNKELLCGPDLMNRLLGRLIRFRQEHVAIMCDIEQMFYSFYVNPSHRTFLRFLWFDENDFNKPVVEYQMNVHIFGNGPSPAIATYGMRKAAFETREQFSAKTLKFIFEDFYVDDGVYSCSTPHEAIQLIKSSQELLLQSNLRLHKVVSNVPAVMESFPQTDLATGLAEIDFAHDCLPTQRTLGVVWDLEKDAFTFQVCMKKKPYTRRGLLSTIHSLYDPLGFLAPVTITGRNILQTLIHTSHCKDNQLGWDDPLPSTLQAEWIRWLDNLNFIPDLEIPRCFKPPHFGKVKKIEIHGFSDASQNAIGIVVYLRLFNEEGDVHVSFLKGQAKVKPQRHLSIPRMELCAAVLLVTTVKDVKRDLEYAVDRTYYYSDSKVVLGYITNNYRRFFVYVANRIELIRSLTVPDAWRYVESELNPSDIATRGCPASKLVGSTWFTGPPFLWNDEIASFKPYPVDDSDEEVRPEIQTRAVMVTNAAPCTLCIYLQYFGDWYKLCRWIAWLKLCCRRWKSAETPLELDPKTLQDAEIIILTHIQQEFFQEELKILRSDDTKFVGKKKLRGLQLYQLDPFLDQHGLIRVGGRIRRAEYSFIEKHPVVLPKRHHVTDLVVRHFHQETHHQGRSITHGAIRQAGYWILGGASLVNSIISKCFRCNYLRRPPEVTKMADLPEDRLHESAPFTHVGMDTFGPWEVTAKKTRGGLSNSKRWCILFTCLASRAIHLEVVDSMDTAAFINALRRFTSIRGPVSTLRCDRGTNFIGAKNELEDALINMEDEQIKGFFLKHKCQWIWNPPHASHFGGTWERQIKTVRRVLEGMLLQLGKTQITHDLLTTLMAEASAIVNSRPLTTVSADPDNPLPLSPGYLLTMKSRPYLRPPGDFSTPDLYCKKRWRKTQYLADQFWVRWKKEYLQSLQPRRKWTTSIRNLQVNDIVLMVDESSLRGLWPKGRVVDVKVSEDGIVRSADVAVFEDDKPGLPQLTGQFRTVTRPVSKLVFLCENVS